MKPKTATVIGDISSGKTVIFLVVSINKPLEEILEDISYLKEASDRLLSLIERNEYDYEEITHNIGLITRILGDNSYLKKIILREIKFDDNFTGCPEIDLQTPADIREYLKNKYYPILKKISSVSLEKILKALFEKSLEIEEFQIGNHKIRILPGQWVNSRESSLIKNNVKDSNVIVAFSPEDIYKRSLIGTLEEITLLDYEENPIYNVLSDISGDLRKKLGVIITKNDPQNLWRIISYHLRTSTLPAQIKEMIEKKREALKENPLTGGYNLDSLRYLFLNYLREKDLGTYIDLSIKYIGRKKIDELKRILTKLIGKILEMENEKDLFIQKNIIQAIKHSNINFIEYPVTYRDLENKFLEILEKYKVIKFLRYIGKSPSMIGYTSFLKIKKSRETIMNILRSF